MANHRIGLRRRPFLTVTLMAQGRRSPAVRHGDNPTMATLRLFAQARDAAGTTSEDFEADTVGGVLDQATEQFGDLFSQILAASKVWCNGEPADSDTPVSANDEVAVLPPVSGG